MGNYGNMKDSFRVGDIRDQIDSIGKMSNVRKLC